MDDAGIRALRDRLAARDMTPVVSAGLDMMGPLESAFRSARLLGATTIRLGLSPVLCGDRNAWGDKWPPLVATIATALAEWGPRAADEGYVLGIENHQDFTQPPSSSPSARPTAASASPSTPATPSPSPRRRSTSPAIVAPHVVHLHLKDYRVQFSPEGYRLIRCAIGDGCVPHAEMIAADPRRRRRRPPPCSSPARSRPATSACSRPTGGTATRRSPRPTSPRRSSPRRSTASPDDADTRTPWERGDDAALEAYELDMIRRSAANMRAAGIMT